MKIRSLNKPIMVFVAVFALLTINSCSNFTLAKELGILLGPIQISPASTTLMPNGSQTFSAVGGFPPYKFSMIESEGSIDEGSGYFEATSSLGISRVRVSDSKTPPNTADAIITVTDIEPLTIVPPVVFIPANNELVFDAIGGVLPYNYSLVPGSAGSVTSAGLYRAPANIGEDEVKVTDSSGNTRTATITITAPQPLTINPKTLIIRTDSDDFLFSASGGKSPYTYKMISGNGNITEGGQYIAPGTASYDVIEVKDFNDLTANAYVRTVEIGPLDILPAVVLPDLKEVTVEQETNFTFEASGGAPPYSYSIVSGPGFIDSSTGKYTAPDTLGIDTKVRVTDSIYPDPATSDAIVHIIPATPTDLDADGSIVSNSEIQLDWINNASFINGFEIEMKEFGDTPIEPNVGSVIASYTYGGLSPSQIYVFKVRAWYDIDPDDLIDTIYSEWSNEAIALTKP